MANIDDLSSRLAIIPALYLVLQYEIKQGGIQFDTLGVCRWIYIRGATALKMLRKYPAPSIEIESIGSDQPEKWQEVQFYAMYFRLLLTFNFRRGPVMVCLKYDTAQSTRI